MAGVRLADAGDDMAEFRIGQPFRRVPFQDAVFRHALAGDDQHGAIVVFKGLFDEAFQPGLGGDGIQPVQVKPGLDRIAFAAEPALAARLVPIADGSDMMGSLRNPAAFNNVVGFRPSFGRIPTLPGRDAYLNQLATLGPMGRSVEDVVTLLNVQSGFDARDPSSFESGVLPLDRDIAAKGGRIGWLGDFGGHLPFEPGVLDLNEKALDVFKRLGFAVEPVRIDFDMNRLWWAWTTLRSFFTAGSMRDYYEDPGRRGSLKPEILYEVRSGLRINAADVYEASAVRTAWYQALSKVFETHDYLIAPAAQVFPFDADIPWPREIAGQHMDTYHRWMEVVIGPSMAGLPVAALPAGFSPQGLPTGFQLIGQPRADAQVLSVAAAYEAATDWLTQTPPLS